jgi:hypothetical protein
VSFYRSGASAATLGSSLLIGTVATPNVVGDLTVGPSDIIGNSKTFKITGRVVGGDTDTGFEMKSINSGGWPSAYRLGIFARDAWNNIEVMTIRSYTNGLGYVGIGTTIPSVPLEVSGSIKASSQGEVRFGDSDNSNYVALKASSAVGANITWALPAADGTAGQLLTTNGSGVLSWSSTSSGTRVTTVADVTSISPNADTSDIVAQTNTQALGTLTINNPSGTPVDGQRIKIRVKSTNAHTLSFGTQFRGSNTLGLPTSLTGTGKTDYFGFIWNAADSKWDLIATNLGF